MLWFARWSAGLGGGVLGRRGPGAGWIVFSVVWGRLRAAMSIASRIRDVRMLSAIA